MPMLPSLVLAANENTYYPTHTTQTHHRSLLQKKRRLSCLDPSSQSKTKKRSLNRFSSSLRQTKKKDIPVGVNPAQPCSKNADPTSSQKPLLPAAFTALPDNKTTSPTPLQALNSPQFPKKSPQKSPQKSPKKSRRKSRRKSRSIIGGKDVPIILTERPCCIHCGVHFSVDKDIKPLSRINCPSCQKRQIITARIDHFICKHRLGRGGMGVTYQAFDESLHRDVAIKIFSKNMTRSQLNIESMVDEARKAAALSHPNIVPIYSIGSADGAPYIVMELLSDDLIYNKVCKGEALEERFTLEVGLSICKALCEANKKQLLHLDVKPANILTDSNGIAKLIDFGLACQMQDPLKGWGTCLYMPPERLTRKGQDWKSDQYSLGISLWHMLAGKAPFTETDIPKLSKIILSEAPPTLATLKPELHEWTAGLIYKMMAYKTDDRYQSYPKLIESFETVLAAL